jgi:hypothetical protein
MTLIIYNQELPSFLVCWLNIALFYCRNFVTMKFTVFIFFFLFALPWNSLAQQDTIYWPTDTAWWCIQDWRYDQQTGETTSLFKYYKMYGDTVVNGHEWQKVHFSRYLAFDSPHNRLQCLTRLEDKVVHIKYMPTSGYADTNEYVLYDFNLVVGDTFQFHLLNWETDSVFEFGVFHRSYYTYSNGFVVGTIAFDWLDHSIPMWGGDCRPNGSLNWQTVHGAINPSPFWMEYRQNFCVDSMAAIQCVHIGDDFTWGGGIQCDSTGVGVQEIDVVRKALIVTDGQIQLPWKHEHSTSYIIYTTMGQRVVEGIVSEELIRLPTISSGIYLLTVKRENHPLLTFKLLKP